MRYLETLLFLLTAAPLWAQSSSLATNQTTLWSNQLLTSAIDCDGSATTGVGTCTGTPTVANLVETEAADALCGDDAIVPTNLRIDGNADCGLAGGTDATLLGDGTGATAVAADVMFIDANANGAYDDSEELYNGQGAAVTTALPVSEYKQFAIQSLSASTAGAASYSLTFYWVLASDDLYTDAFAEAQVVEAAGDETLQTNVVTPDLIPASFLIVRALGLTTSPPDSQLTAHLFMRR